MATPKVPGDQNLLERVNYILKLKVTKFHLPLPESFDLSCIKKASWGEGANLPQSKIGSTNR